MTLYVHTYLQNSHYFIHDLHRVYLNVGKIPTPGYVSWQAEYRPDLCDSNGECSSTGVATDKRVREELGNKAKLEDATCNLHAEQERKEEC